MPGLSRGTGALVVGMPYAFPNTKEIAPGVIMPLINLGNYNLSSNSSLWLELGGRGLDTAYSYHDASLAELGAAVRTSGIPRSEIFVTSKIPCTRGSYVADPEAHIAHSFEVMGLDYVDLMLMHWTCTDGPEATAAVWKALESLVAGGQARAIGVSNFDSQDIDMLLEVATIKPAVNQCEFSISNHDDATFQHCRELNITYSAYSPLGGLSGADVLHHPDVVDVATAHAKSTAQVALRWVVQQGVAAVSASTKASHDMSDLEIFTFELSNEEMGRLTAITAPGANNVVV